MGFQKCPICNGSGKIINTTTSSMYDKCHVCNGHGIIDELNGLPPASPHNTIEKTNFDINGGINGNGESQQEWLGKK